MVNKFLLLSVFTTLILSSSCKKDEYEITVVCEYDKAGDYVIKWETFPVMNGTVKIYRSDNPDDFKDKALELELPVQEGIAFLPKGTFTRSYFKLVFSGKIHIITSNRAIKTENIVNLRGIGGYNNHDDRQVKWNKIYRSGSLSNIGKQDIALLKALHIKTAVDLNTDEEIAATPPSFFVERTFRLPLRGFEPKEFIEKVITGRMKKGDAFIFQQDAQVSLINDNTDYFKRYFEILSDSSNYPIVIHGGFGKDRVGIVALLTLLALDVDEDHVYEDYVLSNSYMNPQKIINGADAFSPEVQEALTSLLVSQRQTIEYAWKQVEKHYGSANNYFEKELGLTHKKREHLKELLLYPKDN